MRYPVLVATITLTTATALAQDASDVDASEAIAMAEAPLRMDFHVGAWLVRAKGTGSNGGAELEIGDTGSTMGLGNLEALLKSEAAQHTALTNVFSGGPARGIVNRAIRELGPLSELAPLFPLAGTAMAPLRAANEKTGSGDFSPLWSGQNNSGCKAISAFDLTRELAAKIG